MVPDEESPGSEDHLDRGLVDEEGLHLPIVLNPVQLVNVHVSKFFAHLGQKKNFLLKNKTPMYSKVKTL